MDNTNRLDISGIGMSTPHISHLAPTNSLNILSPSPQPTSSQSSTVDFSTFSGLKNVNMQVPSGMVNFAGFPGMSAIPGKKDNHEGTCEVSFCHVKRKVNKTRINKYYMFPFFFLFTGLRG